MYKLTFNTPKGITYINDLKNPIDYSDGCVLYYRDNEEDEWKVVTPPARYRARQDCYEKFGKEVWLDKEHADDEKKTEMTNYFNKQVKLYEQEEKTNEK